VIVTKPASRAHDIGPRFGPNAALIVALIARCRLLTPDELLRLQGTAHMWSDRKREPARIEATQVARRAGRGKAWEAAMRSVNDAVESAIPSALDGEISGAVFGVTMITALALTVRDLLAPARFDALVEPWLKAGLPLPSPSEPR
jgi:hypothetical protein